MWCGMCKRYVKNFKFLPQIFLILIFLLAIKISCNQFNSFLILLQLKKYSKFLVNMCNKIKKYPRQLYFLIFLTIKFYLVCNLFEVTCRKSWTFSEGKIVSCKAGIKVRSKLINLLIIYVVFYLYCRIKRLH